MKKLVLGMFIAAITSQAAGCIFVSDDSDDSSDSSDVSDGEEAMIDVGWSWSTVAAPNSGSATCPPGTAITVHSQAVDANGNPVGDEFRDIYDCTINNSITPPLPPTTISVFLSGNGGAGTFTSFTQFVDLTTENAVVDFDLIADGGFVNFQWDLVGATSGDPLECADVSDIAGVGAIVTVADTPAESFDFQYDCEDHTGTTDPLFADDYVISIDAFSNEGSISPVPFNDNVTVTAPNGIAELGLVQIPIEGL